METLLIPPSHFDDADLDSDCGDVDGNLFTAWQIQDTTECGGVLSPRWTATTRLIDTVIVHTTFDGWEEIDAVKLLGTGAPSPDAKGNACDFCPFVADPVSQSDRDGDGVGDSCDCAPGDPTIRPAAEVSGVMATKPAPHSVVFD